jgi:hypothetical protein
MDSCAISALRDIFAFYGLNAEADTLEQPLRKLLSNILEQGRRAVPRDSISRAFATFPPQAVGQYRVEEAMDRAMHLKDLKASGFLGGPEKNSLNAPAILLFLAACGTEPKSIQLCEEAGKAEANAVLNRGEPLIVTTNNIEPLISRLIPKEKPAPKDGHMYVLQKDPVTRQVMLLDINEKQPILVPESMLAEVFSHPDSRAILLQQTPPKIPQSLLGEPSAMLPTVLFESMPSR